MRIAPASGTDLPARLNDLALLAMLWALAAILTVAMVLQFGFGEVPCPLCLLERIAMFGVCFALMLHFQHGHDARHTGLALVFALFLLVVSVRQVLLDICPRPGHDYVGSAVLGLHMPVWSVLIALALIAGFALKLAVLGGDGLGDVAPPPALKRIAGLSGLYVVLLCAVNLVAVAVQCGFGACRAAAG